jgi:hypothetical protein
VNQTQLISENNSLGISKPALVVRFNTINPQNAIEDAIKDLVQNSFRHKNQTVVVTGLLLVGDRIVDAVQMRVVG